MEIKHLNLKVVQIKHYRVEDDPYNGQAVYLNQFYDANYILSRGGATLVIVKNVDTDTLHFGLSVCSFSDNFNKKVGREIAMNRAVQAAMEGRFGIIPVGKHTALYLKQNVLLPYWVMNTNHLVSRSIPTYNENTPQHNELLV